MRIVGLILLTFIFSSTSYGAGSTCAPFDWQCWANQLGGGGSSGGSGSGNEFDDYYKDIVSGDFDDSLADPENEFSGFTITDNVQMPISTIHLNSKNPCTGSCTPGSPPEGQIIPGQRSVPIEAMIPGTLDTQTDYMWSTDAVNMSQNNLNSPQVVWDVSMFLAESAVAQGQQNAFVKAAALNQNALLETLGVAAIGDKFEGSQPVVQSYFWCLQKKLEEGMGLPKARMFCARDKGQKSSGAEGSVGNAAGFSFDTNPAFNASSDAPTVPTRLRLTDIIFNEESLNNDNGDQLIAVRDSFRQIYGDIEFRLTDNSGKFGQEYKFIEASGGSATNLYQEIIVNKFNALRAVMLPACVAMNNIMSGGTPNDSQKLQLKRDALVSAALETSNAELQKISIPGFAMTASALGELRVSYSNIYRGHFQADSESTSYCEPLDNSAPGFVIDFIPDENSFVNFFTTVRQIGGAEFFQELFQMARLLALGEWLVKASIAEQTVDFITSGVNNGSYYETMAKDLIYRTVGSKDIRAELERVIDLLRYQFNQIYARHDQAANSAAQAGSNINQGGNNSQNK